MSCNCKERGVIWQSQEAYDQMITVSIPPHMRRYRENRIKAGLSSKVSIDPCIFEEIKYLWRQGIETHGSCCGHGIADSMVNVHEKDIDNMLAMGYVQNHQDPDRKDTFRLKSEL